jgi:hypothetical protein
MTASVLGVAMLVLSGGGPPAPDGSRLPLTPAAIAFELPDDRGASSPLARPRFDASSRPAWQRRQAWLAQSRMAGRFSKTERVIAVVAGAAGGFMLGGVVGWAATSKPDDDVSGLKGVVIGAPIGAAVGAFIGYAVTK